MGTVDMDFFTGLKDECSDPDYDPTYDSDEEKKKKKKSWRQIRHEEDLKRRGVWKEPSERYDPKKRLCPYPKSELVMQTEYQRGRKYWDGELEVLITHVDSARAIYLLDGVSEQITAGIAEELVKYYEGQKVPSLPPTMIRPGYACVYKHENTWYRCRIIDRRSGSVMLHLSDVGKRIFVEEKDFRQLKILLHPNPSSDSYLDAAEQAVHSKIPVLCDNIQSPSEISLLKELLPIGTRITPNFDHRKGNLGPFRAHIRLGDQKFHDVFGNEAKKRGIYSCYLEHLRQMEQLRAAQPPPQPPQAEAARAPPPFEFEYSRRMAALEVANDRDHDPNASIEKLTEEQEMLVKTWVACDNICQPKDIATAEGLKYDEVQSLESNHYWENESESEWESGEYQCLARDNDSSDVVVYK